MRIPNKFSIMLYVINSGNVLLALSTFYEASRVRDILINSRFRGDLIMGGKIFIYPKMFDGTCSRQNFLYTSRKKIIAWYLKGKDIDPISEELRSDITADWFQFSISLQIDARDVEDFNNFLRSEIIERFDYLVFNRYHQRILQ